MEQKKILWTVIAVCAFGLIIFGFALILYRPSKNDGPQLRNAVAVSPASPTATASGVASNPAATPTEITPGIDPDSWVREPEKTPGLDTVIPPSPNNINLTIVNGDNSYGTMDVSGLSKTPAKALPADAKLTENGPTATSGTAPATSSATGGTATAQTEIIASGTTSQTSPAVKPATANSSKAEKAVKTTTAPKTTPKSTSQSKVTTVVEYWIQTGSFSSKLNAEKARETLRARYLNAEIFTKEVAGKTTFRVRVGPYQNRAEADYWLGTVTELPSFGGSYVSEVKVKK